MRHWSEQVLEIVEGAVDAMVSADRHILVPCLENLQWDVARTSAEIFAVDALVAASIGKEDEVADELKTARSNARISATRMRDKTIRTDLSGPLVSAQVEVDQEVRRLTEALRDAQRHRRNLETMLRALKVKSNLLPGLQGRDNNRERNFPQY